MIIGLAWTGVLLIHFLNIEKMDQIRDQREQGEILMRDQQFWNNNADNISQVLQRYSSFSQKVESLKLGLLRLEDHLRGSALNSGLKGVTFTRQPEIAAEGITPIKLSFIGTFAEAVRWLDMLQKDLPCLRIQDIKISLDPLAEQTTFQVSINYHYTVSDAESAA